MPSKFLWCNHSPNVPLTWQWRSKLLFKIFIWDSVLSSHLLLWNRTLNPFAIKFKRTSNLSPVGDLVRTIRNSLSSNNHSSIDNLVILKYASHSTNSVAHNLAHISSEFSAHKIWFNNFPYQLYPLIISNMPIQNLELLKKKLFPLLLFL